MLTSASDYADLFNALQQSCTNLVGSAGITAADCVEVADAVAAVEMSTLPPAAPNPEAPVCGSGLVPADLFADDLENPSSGNWTAQAGWYYPQNPNPFFDATYATSGTRNMWGDDQGSKGDYSISMNRSIAIPAGSSAFLRFNHAYGFEDDGGGGYDGGVLEVSTNNGATYVDAGSLLSDNGYNGPVTAGFGNPALDSTLAGRQAFIRESSGYISSRATLSSLAGQSVRFRFHIGTDASNGDYGWFIDDIRMYTCAPPPPPPPPPDADGDGVPDSSDACPAVAASTPNGCPAAGGGGGTTGSTGTGTGTGTGGTAGAGATQPTTLRSAGLKSCKRTGRGQRVRVKCVLTRFSAVRRMSVKVTRRGRTFASGSGRPTGGGALAIKPRRALRPGTYKVAITLRDAAGKTRRLTGRLKVR